MRISRFVALAVLSLVLIPPAQADEFTAPGPEHAIASPEPVVLRDETRGKDLQVHVNYPAGDEGPWPLVIFSHGAGGSGRGVEPLTRYWASQGYVCLAPTHEDSLSLRREGDSPNLFSAEGVENRAHDVRFLIDSLPQLVEKVPPLKGKIDRERIGVGGHSYGAFTTMVIGGATLRRPDGLVSYADERADADAPLASSPARADANAPGRVAPRPEVGSRLVRAAGNRQLKQIGRASCRERVYCEV